MPASVDSQRGSVGDTKRTSGMSSAAASNVDALGYWTNPRLVPEALEDVTVDGVPPSYPSA